MIKNRLNKVIIEMKKRRLSQIIISSPSSIFYLTGNWFISGERMLVLLIKSNGEHRLFINKVFKINKDLKLNLDIEYYDDYDNPIEILAKFINKKEKLGVDKRWPSKFLLSLMEVKGASAYETSFIIEYLRMVKDKEEIELMKKSFRRNDKTMKEFLENIKEGMTEIDCVKLLKKLYSRNGIDRLSFSPIVAFSSNSSELRHIPNNSILKKGDNILIDIGGVYKSYCSDMTRTVFFKKEPYKKYKKIYNVLKSVNEKAISMIKPGIRFCDIDNFIIKYISDKGYGDYIANKSGHCIGISCHDFGDVSKLNTLKLKAGMIFSIEPGIYLENDIGIRIEDLVLVTGNGSERLNKLSKELTVIK